MDQIIDVVSIVFACDIPVLFIVIHYEDHVSFYYCWNQDHVM